MKIVPPATVDDGLLDVLVLGDFSPPELVAQIWKVYPGKHLEHPKVVWRRGARVEIEPMASTRLDLDGELYGAGPYSLSVLPQALAVLT